jgi:chorismate dehydratase
MRVAKIPYLNSQPFYAGFDEAAAAGIELVEMAPRELGRLARAARIDAGLIPIADAFAVEREYERLGAFGIAVTGRVESVILLSERPLSALSGARIGLTEESSTSVRLLRLLVEARDGARPAAYVRGARESADAYLLIGDEALGATAAGPPAPFVFDLAEEWERWQRLPFVFAVWVVRRGVFPGERARLAALLERSLAAPDRLARIAAEYATGPASRRALGPAARLARYLARFTYRLGPDEEAAIARFRALLRENDIACDGA